MIYFDIIFKTIFDIILFKNFFQTSLFLIFIYLIYNLSKQILSNGIQSKLILCLRIIILLFIMPLFLNNVYKIEETINTKQNIGIMIDNSLSVKKIISDKNIDIYRYIDKIEEWSNNNKIKMTLFNLDTIVKKGNFTFHNNFTSFELIKNIKTKYKIDQLVLISDGMVNTGIINNDYFSNTGIPIHTLGIGNKESNDDIGFNDLQIEKRNDSLNFFTSINVKASNDIIFKYEIFSDDILIYIDTLKLQKGFYNLDRSISLKSNKIGKKITSKIEGINFIDSKKSNNIWSTHFNTIKEKSILLLTGKLTYNSKFIKSNLSKISNINLTHHNISNNEFNKEKILDKHFDYIILDNFPDNDFQYNLLEFIDKSNIKYLFIEGIDYNIDYLIKIFNKNEKSNFYYDKNFKEKELILDNNIKLSVKPTFNLFCKKCKKNNVKLYTDGSIAELKLDNNTYFFIPNISELSFYYKNKYSISYIDKYFQYLINKNLNNNSLLNFNLNKNNYSIGEKIKFSIVEKIPFDINNKKIIIRDMSELRVDTLIYDEKMELMFSKEGIYEIYLSFLGTNSELINSNKIDVIVYENNIELETNNQNYELLKNISINSGGTYSDFHTSDLDVLSKIKTSFIKENQKKIFTALDIFIKNKIYLFIIIFFCLEIYLRKRIGLL